MYKKRYVIDSSNMIPENYGLIITSVSRNSDGMARFEGELLELPTYAMNYAEYVKHDIQTIQKIIDDYDKHPHVKEVIFNKPATIIKWMDGTKTVVKCQSGDEYDPEKGFTMAYLKKLLGNDNTFNKEIKQWVRYD